MAERFEAADEATFHGGAVALVKGGGTEVAVRDILGEHVVDDDEEGVGDGDRRALGAPARRRAARRR